MSISDRIKQLREKKEMSQEELSNVLGTKRATLGNWETGRSEPDTKMIKKIADYFEVSTDYLMGRSDIKEGTVLKAGDKTYTVIGGSDFTDEEWKKITDNFEMMVDIIKAKRNKK